MQSPLAIPSRKGDVIVVAVSGEWNLRNPAPSFASVVEQGDGETSPGDSVRATEAISVNGADLGEWDSSLLIFLRQGQEYCDSHKLEWRTDALPGRITSLLALAHVVPERVIAPEAKRLPAVARLGAAALSAWDGALTAVTFMGSVVQAAMGLPTGRVRMRWREFWVVVQANGSGALPIVTLIAALMGIIIAFLGVVVLDRFGAGYYSSYLVGYGMLREMGALMTGIIIAGRTGAGFAAELGSMKISEEIDAYSTLGVSPIEHLVLPRVLGIFVMLPLLVVYADFIGIMGGMAVAVTMVDLSAEQFITGLLTAVELSDAMLGIAKATIFGAIIGLAGCMRGLQAGTDAGAVGRATTSAVVLAITLIIVANTVVDWLAALLNL
jgi:phospholipid/cholesterol/gamma-HCH transport system permease protein